MKCRGTCTNENGPNIRLYFCGCLNGGGLFSDIFSNFLLRLFLELFRKTFCRNNCLKTFFEKFENSLNHISLIILLVIYLFNKSPKNLPNWTWRLIVRRIKWQNQIKSRAKDDIPKVGRAINLINDFSILKIVMIDR